MSLDFLKNKGRSRSKFKAKRNEYNGIKFASLKERDRYIILLSRERLGEITDLKCHPPFKLSINQSPLMVVGKNGKMYQSRYVADFSYWENGKFVVEDVKPKGMEWDKVFRLKQAIFNMTSGYTITVVV